MQPAGIGSNPTPDAYEEDPPRFGVGVGTDYEKAISVFETLQTLGRVSLHRLDDGEYIVGMWLDVSEDRDSPSLEYQIMSQIINLFQLEDRLPPDDSEYGRSCYGSGLVERENEVIAPDLAYPLLVPEQVIGEDAWKAYLDDLAQDEADLKQRLIDAPGWSPGTPRTADDALRWLVRGLIYAPGVGVLYGPDGELKTFTAIDIAVHIAAGLDEWAGLSNA